MLLLWLSLALFQHAFSAQANEIRNSNQDSFNNAPTFTFEVVNADHIIIAWEREGPWTNETRYHVKIRHAAQPGMNWCYTTSYICFTKNCTIDTKNVCPLPMDPCTSYSVQLEGENVKSKWQYIQTAPDDYGGLHLEVEGQTLHIQWAWPEIPPQQEACISTFLITVTSVGKKEVIKVPRIFYPNSITPNKDVVLKYDYQLGLCDTGGGVVLLQAAGASGQSEGQVRGFTYHGDGATQVLTFDPMEITSTSIKTSWHLNEDCPLIDNFMIYAIDAQHEVVLGPYYSTICTHTYKHLQPNTDYNMCVLPLGSFGETLPAGDNICQLATTLP